jgi:hypothetical protein
MLEVRKQEALEAAGRHSGTNQKYVVRATHVRVMGLVGGAIQYDIRRRAMPATCQLLIQ